MTVFLLNLAILCFVLFVCALQIDAHSRLTLDRYRFKYFALRDRLALMVMKGDIDEDSWEYENLIGVLNFHIKTVESFSVDHIINALVKYHSSNDEMRRVMIIRKKLDHPQVIELTADIMDVTASLLRRNSRTQLRYLRRRSKAGGFIRALTPEPTVHSSQLKQVVEQLRGLGEELKTSVSAVVPATTKHNKFVSC